jgi:YidC/Oxa1 family membrane protein insertase
MDRLGITVITVCVLLMGVWLYEEHKLADQYATDYAREQALHPTPTNAPASIATAPNTTATGNASLPASASAAPFDTSLPEHTLVVTNADGRYTFTSRGGGLKLVELPQYPETISLRWKKTAGTDHALASLNTDAEVPTLAILGDPALVGDGNFTLTRTATGVQAEKMLPDGLRIIKNFELSSNYLINATVRLENRTDKPLSLPAQEWVVGTATPMDADDNGMVEGAMWYNGNAVQDCSPAWFGGGGFGCVSRTPRSQYLEGSNNVYWAAVHNQFFTLMAMPPTNLPARQILATPVTLPLLATDATGATPTGAQKQPIGVQTALVYPGLTISANSGVERSLVLYAGPKEYRLLAQIGADFQNHADLVMNFGTGFSSFFGIGTFFAKALLLGMNWIHDVTTLGYGWTIVLITMLLRAMFWPLTAASTRSMKRMQALAPELKVLQEKYKDDSKKLMEKQWELYKKHKANPMSGCLPMMIQMPVFLGFYTMIRSAIELRGAHFLWVADLTKPDTLAIIPGLNIPFNLLPLLMVTVMIWQAHLQPPSPGMDPGQQKMMRFMPLMFLFFLYNYSSGMALYMTISTLAGVIQNKLTRINPPASAATIDVVATDPRLTPASKKQK